MPGSEEFVQRVVHTLETGAASVWLRRTFIAVVIGAVAVIFLVNFRGLATSQAMDQAQIGRAIASGHGWQTNFARPLAASQLQRHGRNMGRIWTDVYNAPLPPLVNAIALFPFKSHLKMTARQIIYLGDRIIAGLGLLLFFASLGAQFLLINRLFDRRLALISCTFLLLCDTMWQYALSGLPQMLLLLLFNLTLFAVLRAVEERVKDAPTDRWLAAAGAGFGLLALSHGLTIWMFLAAVVFAGFFFPQRTRAVLILLGAFLILYAPWLVRNWVLCGNPFGLGFYSMLAGMGGHDEAGWFRQVAPQFAGVSPAALREKFVNNLILQFGRPVQYLGESVVAAVFFLSLLHRFRRAEINILRWVILALWCGAVLGMAVFGLDEEQGFTANQLHLLFVPAMTAYGLAWLLLQWRQFGFELRLARIGFLAFLLLLCTFPMANTLYGMLFGSSKPAVRWPPYIPPYLAVLNEWMQPDEVTASDIPWAVAWYADRRSLLVPKTVKELNDIGSSVFNAPVAALYLTPVSGAENKLGDITHGDYAEWAAVIEQTGDLSKYPFKWGTLMLGFEKECEFLSDRDRSVKQPQ